METVIRSFLIQAEPIQSTTKAHTRTHTLIHIHPLFEVAHE